MQKEHGSPEAVVGPHGVERMVLKSYLPLSELAQNWDPKQKMQSPRKAEKTWEMGRVYRNIYSQPV